MKQKSRLQVKYIKGERNLGNDFLKFLDAFQVIYLYVKTEINDKDKIRLFDNVLLYKNIWVIEQGKKKLKISVGTYLKLWDLFVEELSIMGILDFGYKKLKPEITVMKVLEPKIVEDAVKDIVKQVQKRADIKLEME